MVKETFIAIVKLGTITFTICKAFKVAGKPDFSNIIALAGVFLCGICIIKLIKYWIINPPLIISLISKLIWALEKIANK